MKKEIKKGESWRKGYQMGVSEISDKIKELTDSIEFLERSRTVTIVDQRPISTTSFPMCNCNLYPNNITKPPCPVHGSGLYPQTIC